jgi:PKD repeat protein
VNQEIDLDGSGSFHPAAKLYESGHRWYDEIVLWEWDLDDDGVFETSGEIVQKSWSKEGFYSVTLRVTDGGGLYNEKRTNVIITSSIHDVAVDALALSKNENIGVGDVISIDVTVSNIGDDIESFDLTLYCNNDVIDSVRVKDLAPDENEHLSFTWDTLDVSAGSCKVKACAAVVPGEFSVANNCLETTVEIIDTYILSTSSTRGGSVTKPGEGTFTYNSNTTVEIEATADDGYVFLYWTGSAVRAGKVANPEKARTTVRMDGDYSLMASFTFLPW